MWSYRIVDAESCSDAFAVDGVDPGNAPGTGRLGDIGKQQPDRALADDRDVPPGQVRQLFAGIEHARQRLQADRLRRAQRRIVRSQHVAVADHAFHQAVEPGCPAHHAIAGAVFGVAAGDHLAGHFVDREPVLFGGAFPIVPRKPAACTPKGRQIAAADAGGRKPQQHLAIGQALGGVVRDRRALEQIGGDDPVGPHVRPPPGSCSIPTGSWTASGSRPRF